MTPQKTCLCKFSRQFTATDQTFCLSHLADLLTVAEPGQWQTVSAGALAAPLLRPALPLRADRLPLVTPVRAVPL